MTFRGWPVKVPAEYSTEWSAATDEQRDRASDLAATVLWTLTGQVFGTVTETVRPCFRPDDAVTSYGVSWAPGMFTGGGPGPCGCSSDCRHVGHDRVALPGPVASVTSILVDGDTVDPSAYRVQDRRWVRRVDGLSWPTDQDLDAADAAVGAFTITYVRGVSVPAAGQAAAGRLAVEFLRDMTAGPDRRRAG